MIFIYRILYAITKTIIQILRPFLNPKMQDLIKLRNQALEQTKTFAKNNTYWFHASSGEIEYCKSVIRLLKEKMPDASVVVTYSSPSAEKLFYNITEYVDQFIPLPWDQPKAINTLINYIKPKTIIFAKTDLWPELVEQAKKQNIKTGVISFNDRHNFFTDFTLKKLDFISTIEKDGDTRFDQVFYRLEQPPKLKLITENKVFICGSTWREDETFLFEKFAELKKQNIKIILSPHEVASANIERVQKELNKRGLNFQSLSNESDPQNIIFSKDVFIIDKIGFLADAYRFANVAFVGGSFKDKVHSVMEPLCSGLPVITGPFYKNNLEAVKYLGRFVFVVRSSEDLAAEITKLTRISRDEIVMEMRKNKNASERAIARFL